MYSHKHLYKWLLFVVTILSFTSCATRKVVYNPQEVSHLSRRLNIPIHNDDPNIPLYAQTSLWLGVPYRYGGNSKSGVDCSGFVVNIFRKVYNKQLERSTTDLAKKNVKKIRKKNLKAGDLVFFSTSKKSKKINHVGIFLKDGYFIHASTSKGVIVSNLNEKFYQKAWRKAGRVIWWICHWVIKISWLSFL